MRNQFKVRRSIKILAVVFFAPIIFFACTGEPNKEVECMNKAHSQVNRIEKIAGDKMSKQERYDYVNKVCNR